MKIYKFDEFKTNEGFTDKAVSFLSNAFLDNDIKDT